MKKSQIILLILVLSFSFLGCSSISNSFNRETMTITLEPNRKMVSITYKDKNMWILTKEMKSTDIVEIYNFEEYSKYGILDGKLIIKEKRG